MNTRKTALITGSATRLGRTTALHLATHGWDVAVHYRHSQAEAEQTVQDIAALGQRAVAIQGDLEDATSLPSLIARAAEALGGLTALVNNAAVFERGDLHTLDAAQFHTHMNTNLLAPLLLAQAFVQQLGTEKGAIVNLLDGCEGMCLSPNFLAYTLSKRGLQEATALLAKGLAPQVRVNAIAPGLALPKAGEEEMFDRLTAKSAPEMVTPPERIATMVLSLLEDNTVSGEVITPGSRANY